MKVIGTPTANFYLANDGTIKQMSLFLAFRIERRRQFFESRRWRMNLQKGLWQKNAFANQGR